MRRMYSQNQLENEIKEVKKDINTLVDANGHDRFIEGNGVSEITGLTNAYCKWALSGSHLLLVCAGNVADGSSILTNDDVATFTLPEWIYNKIIPVWASTRIEAKNTVFYNDDWSSQSVGIVLTKLSGNTISFKSVSDITFTKDRAFRVAFDLLIDND